MSLSLITNSGGEGELYELIKSKLKSDGLTHVDVIVSYIKRTGIETGLLNDIRSNSSGAQFRIITTFQLGLSDFEDGVEELAKLGFAGDTGHTRNTRNAGRARTVKLKLKIFQRSRTFHAKGWLFRYNDATKNTAVIGSSNISSHGLRTGVEWNVVMVSKSNKNTADIMTKFKTEFDILWEQSDLVTEENLEHMRSEFQFQSLSYDELVRLFGTQEECAQWRGLSEKFKIWKGEWESQIRVRRTCQARSGNPMQPSGSRLQAVGVQNGGDSEMTDAAPVAGRFNGGMSGFESKFRTAVESFDLQTVQTIMNDSGLMQGERDRLVEQKYTWTGEISDQRCSPLWFLLGRMYYIREKEDHDSIRETMKFLLKNGADPNESSLANDTDTLKVDDQGVDIVPIHHLLMVFIARHKENDAASKEDRKSIAELISVLIDAKGFDPNAMQNSYRSKQGCFAAPALAVMVQFRDPDDWYKDEYKVVWKKEYEGPFVEIAVKLLEKGAEVKLPLKWTLDAEPYRASLDECPLIAKAVEIYNQRVAEKAIQQALNRLQT